MIHSLDMTAAKSEHLCYPEPSPSESTGQSSGFAFQSTSKLDCLVSDRFDLLLLEKDCCNRQ